jgi:hypothetical protein
MMIQQLQNRLDRIQINNVKLARLVCRIIPASCPFKRSIKLMGYAFNIPPLCKINPLYDHLMGLRFRALQYLAAR